MPAHIVAADTLYTLPITDEELSNLPLPTANAIEIDAFVALEHIDPNRMGAGCYLAVGGQAAAAITCCAMVRAVNGQSWVTSWTPASPLRTGGRRGAGRGGGRPVRVGRERW